MEDSSKQAPLDDQKIMMRSLSNKVRAYSDDIDQDSDDNAGIHVTKPLQWGQASMGTSESQETRSTRNPRLSDEEREAMATFVRAQGQELMSQLEQQKKRCLIEDAGGNMPDTEAMAMLEKEQMKRLIADRKPRDSEEYMNGNTTTEESEVESSAKISGKGSQDHPQQLHSETDEKNDREYDSNGERFLYRSSTDSDGNHHVQDNTGLYGNLKSLVNEEPAKVLDWLRGEDREMEKEKRILLSKDRILSLLQAFKDGGNGKEGSGAAFNRDDWVPAERLREAERRSSIAEEQIKYFEELFNARDCSSESESEEQLRGALTKAKTMERHFAHMRKFADDKHSDLKRRYSSIISAAREGTKPSWSIISRDHKIGYMNEEKAKKELQDYENQRKRLVQVYSTYNELLKIVKVEHAKRKQAQTKTVQLTSQLERHTATLKRAERVIKHAALKPSLDAFHEPLLSRSQSGLSHDPHLSAFSTTNLRSSLNSQRRSPSPNGFVSFPASASATHQPYTFHDHMDRPRSRATSPAPSVYHHDHHHADRPDSRASSPTPTGHYHHQQIHHNSTQRQLSNDGEFANFQNGFSEASSPRASSAAPLDRSRLSSTGSDLVVPEQRRRKEFQELEDALIQEGRSKGFADVNLYTEKKVVGKEETCWEYRHVHFDFNKSQTGSEGHHDEVESKAAAPSASHVVDDSCTSADQIQVYEERLGTKTTSFHGSHSSHDGVQNSTALNDDERSHLLSSPRSIASYQQKQENIQLNLEKLRNKGNIWHLHRAGSPKPPLNARALASESPRTMHIDTNKGSPRSPLKTSSRSPRNASERDFELGKMTRPEPGEENLEGFEQKMCDSAADSRVHDAIYTDEIAAESESKIATEQNTGMRVSEESRMHGARAVKPRYSAELDRRLAAVEAGNHARALRRQVKKRWRLLLVQVVLMSVAFLWGVPSSIWQSSPPPT